jgi:hypothetical protein
MSGECEMQACPMLFDGYVCVAICAYALPLKPSFLKALPLSKLEMNLVK